MATIRSCFNGLPEKNETVCTGKLSRIKRTGEGLWPAWPLAPLAIISPFAAQYTDIGAPLTLTDPWGTDATTNWYQYLVRGVDVASNVGPGATSPQVSLPGETTSTTVPTSTTISTTTTTEQTYTVVLQNTTNFDREFVITQGGVEYLRQILAAKPNHANAPLVPVSGLPAGTYTVTASRIQGNAQTDTGTFDLPTRANQTVFY